MKDLFADQQEAEFAAQALDVSADYIDEHGWCQGDYTDPNGAVCAFGAVDMTTRARYTDFANQRRLTFRPPASDLESFMRGMDSHRIIGFRSQLIAALNVQIARETGTPVHGDVPPTGRLRLVIYNDDPARTASDVTSLMRKTAITLREEVI